VAGFSEEVSESSAYMKEQVSDQLTVTYSGKMLY
jgi:hypothetical protein